MAQLTRDQQQILSTLLGVAQKAGATPREVKALVEAGLVESNLRNLNYGDRDSLGVLQQRSSQGWGNATDPAAAAGDFLAAAQKLSAQGFQGSAGQLAQAVQRSAFPARYDQQGALAASLIGQPSSPSTARTTTTVTPGVDNSALRTQLIAQYALSNGNPNALTTLAAGLLGANDVPGSSRTTTTRAKPKATSGVATFEGKKVDAWMVPALKYARANGWKGTITSGVRTRAQQAQLYADRASNPNPVAKPGTSNHEIENGGAVDVSDPDGLEQALAGYKGKRPRRDPSIGDAVHFSATGR